MLQRRLYPVHKQFVPHLDHRPLSRFSDRTIESAIVFAIMIGAIVGYFPALQGTFATDDYVFIATSRMQDAPATAFTTSHFFEPLYFRPVGLLFWWISDRLFSQNFVAHALLTLSLHLASTFVMFLLLSSAKAKTAPKLLAVALFAFSPYTYPATLWLSNRFDLLATLFLLLAMLACSRLERRAVSAPIAFACVLFACWSKEWAIAVCAVLALREGLRAKVLGGAIVLGVALALTVRNLALSAEGHQTVQNLVTLRQVLGGLQAWGSSVLGLPGALSGAPLALALAAAAGIALTVHIRARTASMISPYWLLALFAAATLPQTITIAGFAPLVETGVFGAANVARFTYAPALFLCLLVGLGLSLVDQTKVTRGVAIGVIAVLIGLGILSADRNADGNARWARSEVLPLASAAASVADAAATAQVGMPCVIVMLDTQSSHPYFRMFSDATVKALTHRPTETWSCQILTESTPWIFISPASQPLPEIGLRPIVIDAQGTPKPDYAWGGVRYRYRAMVDDVTKLPNARFFAWNGSAFDEVTQEVMSGMRVVKTHGWGF